MDGYLRAISLSGSYRRAIPDHHARYRRFPNRFPHSASSIDYVGSSCSSHDYDSTRSIDFFSSCKGLGATGTHYPAVLSTGLLSSSANLKNKIRYKFSKNGLEWELKHFHTCNVVGIGKNFCNTPCLISRERAIVWTDELSHIVAKLLRRNFDFFVHARTCQALKTGFCLLSLE